MSKAEINIGSSNLFTLLTVLFVGLKLTGYINWSWWLVLSPLWGGFIFMFIYLFIALIIRSK